MDTASKVTVEYRDPSDVFKLITRDINARLPLRNLDWKAPNRPVRQIKSLHLEFVPDALTKNTLQPPAPRQENERSTSFDIVGNGATKNTVKERRHQIPGLQTSPFLKIYVIRCDDKDRYKQVERERVKDWLKGVTSTKKNGNHDACEWLILHVVIPDTTAASEPRWREAPATAAEDQDELLERKKQGAKWPGKSKRTVFDKLRADFNEPGKSGQDRVAQIKIPKEGFPVDLLPTPAVAATLKETPEERDKAWNDLMGKIRVLTLSSFDQRVRQYQSDIVEQELRRSMPGFNFCTFFIYKEGMAKALESVGLSEDALVIYDELALGLETAVRDFASGNGSVEGTATTFANHTADIKERITGEEKVQTNGTDASDGWGEGDKSLKEKAETVENEFRERIARSEISVFDFFTYLHSRQQSIILRIANAQNARAKLGLTVKEGSEDLILISEVCWRATTFIHNNARILRQDLLRYREDKPWTELDDNDVEALVASWMYDAAGKVLDLTAGYEVDNVSLPERGESLGSASGGGGGYGTTNHSRSESNLSTGGGIPQRTTSLPPKKSRVMELQGRSSLQSASESDLVSRPSSSSTDTPAGNFIASQPGLAELITYRASLVMLQRKALEVPAKQRGWFAGWASVREKRARESKEVEIDLNGDVEEPYENGIEYSSEKKAASKLMSPNMLSQLSSEDDFYEAYGRLSEEAMRYFVTSTQTKSTESIIGDLAILKSQQGEYEYAISYFQHVLQLYAEDGWSLMEAKGIKIYASCLRKTKRNEEYVQTMLMLLAKICERRKETKVPRWKYEIDDSGEAEEREDMLSDLVAFSTMLNQEVEAGAERYFSTVRCEREIQHFDDTDGFAIRVHVHHVLDEAILFETARLCLISTEDPNQTLWLRNRHPINLSLGANEFDVECNAVAFGAYWIDKLVLQAGMLQFEYDFRFKQPARPVEFEASGYYASARKPESAKQPWVFLYPAVGSFDAEVSLPKNAKPEARNLLEIWLSSGRNDVRSVDLKLKPASAGLRLYLTDARMPDIGNGDVDASTAGCLALGGIKMNNSALVQVPYSLEQSGKEIVVRLEVWYHTSDGSFMFTTTSRVPTKLPLEIDVRDTFQFDTLFSTFTMRGADRMPLCITNADLESSLKYEVRGPPRLEKPMVLFDQQPVKLLYKITRKAADMENPDAADNKLTLTTHYYTVDEVLRQALVTSFGDALRDSPLVSLSRLLMPLLLSRVKSLSSTSDMEMALLLHEVPTPSFEDVAWQEVIPTLPSAIRPQLTNWLKLWHSKNTSIPLSHEMAEAECLRRITISVDVPQVDVVHKASLVLPRETIYNKALPPIIVLGQPITVKLRITSTTEWSDRSSKRLAKVEDKIDARRFIYDVQADPDTWLIGGQRRIHFTASENGEQGFELLLVPLKRGTWALPYVDIHLDRSGDGHDTASAKDKDSGMKCESFCESAAQVVDVIRDVNRGRVHLSEPHSSLHSRTGSRAQVVKDGG